MGRIIDRRRVMGGKLPYDAEIEYLESTGTQYIDTGFKHNQDTRFVAQMSFVKVKAWKYPFGSFGGAKDTNKLFCLETNDSGVLGSYYRASKSFGITAQVGTIYTIDFNKNVHRINNTTITHTADYFASIYNDLIFGCTGYTDIATGGDNKVRFYYFKIYDNGVLVRDYIPVRVGQIGYMYDKVSGQLFGNAGTGDFILGPDKNSVTIITQQQQHEMYG